MIITLRISHAIFITRLQRNGQPLATPPYIHCILNLYKSRRGLFSKMGGGLQLLFRTIEPQVKEVPVHCDFFEVRLPFLGAKIR